ncbi:hypothetical protein [Ochrobactrum sp. CGA5]|uniref:hypothetical protein n=1 Tax=Ochrobactrum sp. CGA5 TaxID=2583453 RepID=UPI001AED4FE5|nr:hypothetical protein [Ochrobactrum sp. CGA5]
MAKITKTRLTKSLDSGIRAEKPDADLMRFSFKLFDHSDDEVCPAVFRNGYTRALMSRLRDLSTWKVSEFTSNRSSAIRAHPIDWNGTSRKDGFDLNEQYQAYTPWQFSISANEDGRVIGLLIDDCFYVVWLDHHHKVYPGA